jgi:arylsulfate sulfotransferase
MRLRLFGLAVLATTVPLSATVTITSFSSGATSPQPLGTPVAFTVTATDSNPGPLAFQFNMSYADGAFTSIRNFNIGTFSDGVWTAQPFSWTEIAFHGAYTIQVVAQDFVSGETATANMPFDFKSILTGSGMSVVSTPNSLVALASISNCPTGSSGRVFFMQQGTKTATTTPFQPCGPTGDNNVYLGGMYPNTTYTVGFQTKTGSTVTTGKSTASFTTGLLATDFAFPTQTELKPPTTQSDTAEKVLLHAYITIHFSSYKGPGIVMPVATDLAGSPIWYYDGHGDTGVQLSRPVNGGTFLIFQSGLAWSNGSYQLDQIARQIDLSGNILKETNIGLLQQQLLAMGATDLQSCANVQLPAAVGSACLTSFSHDMIVLPNGGYAVIGSMEKIFPPGLNVDILGDSIIILDPNLNPLWYFDSFQHDGGGTQLDINRPATLAETCAVNQGGCPILFLAGTPGVTPLAKDWMHSNSIQYRSSDGDLVISARHQDWVFKIDYNNGSGTGDLLWRMGPDGDFTFNNTGNNAYPWFSHQHDAGFETTGVFDVFDNGNTRIAQEGGGNSRGMVLTVDEPALTVTPVLVQNLGYFGIALGSAQLLSNGNYHFQPGIVEPNNLDYSQEFAPVSGTLSGTGVYNLESGCESYRSFRMPDLYTAPTT